jgi:nucleotide-binding universal stress UspA family protein
LAVFYLISYILLTITGRLLFKREDAIAMVFGVVMRDLSIALAIAMTAFGKEGMTIALLISLAYIIQIQTAAWYVKFIDVIFGKPKAEIEEPPEQAKSEAIRVPDSERDISMIIDVKKILFATDLSETARHAVKYACSIGNKYGAQVHAIHVVPDVLDEYSSGTGTNVSHLVDAKKWKEFNRKNIETAKNAMRERMRMTSQKVLKQLPHCPLSEGRIIVTAGNPVDEIVKIALADNFDLIIMGTHGHGQFEEMMIGSTASGVILKSKVPVLVARPSSS